VSGAKVVKRDGIWTAFDPAGRWLGGSSRWAVAVALALGEPVEVDGMVYRSGSLSGVKAIIGGSVDV
jgi:hypothetical protein